MGVKIKHILGGSFNFFAHELAAYHSV